MDLFEAIAERHSYVNSDSYKWFEIFITVYLRFCSRLALENDTIIFTPYLFQKRSISPNK